MAWRPQGSESWPWARKRAQGSKSDWEDATSVCECVQMCMCVWGWGGVRHCFKFFLPTPTSSPIPTPTVGLSPLPTLHNSQSSAPPQALKAPVSEDPLFQKPEASQLAPQLPIASWHPD